MGIKWTECVPENKEFTDRYDAAIREVRKEIGSYEKISQALFADTGHSVAGVSIRRWIQKRALPLGICCWMIDRMEGKIHILDFFPYLEVYVNDFLE
jgi:hypothetical protein